MLISSPEEKYEAKLIKELGDDLQPMSTPGMAVFTLRFEKLFCFFSHIGKILLFQPIQKHIFSSFFGGRIFACWCQISKLARLVLITFPSLAKSCPKYICKADCAVSV